MLSKTCFDRCMNALLAFADVSIDKKKNQAFYSLFQNDFEDDEFSKICGDICRTEILYNKYPAPALFYERKESKKVLIEIGSFYLDDTMPEYKPYLRGVSDEQQERIWKWIYNNKLGEQVSIDWIIEIIKKFTRYCETDVNMLEYNPEVKKLLSNSIKKIGG